MYAHYTTISDNILRDLLSAKSKVTDLQIYVDSHQAQLARVHLLGPLRLILDSTRYDEDMLALLTDKEAAQ